MSDSEPGPTPPASPWRWVLLTAGLALLKFEVVPGRSLSPMGIGLVLTAALHGPLCGGLAGIASGLARALATGHHAFVPALPLSGLAIGWAATRIPFSLAGITVLWVCIFSAPLMGAGSMLSGASDVAGLSAAARSMLDGLMTGMIADLAYPHLRGAWGPAPTRRLPHLLRATYLGMLLTTALLVGAVLVLHQEHQRLQEAARRVNIEHMRAHTQASATDVQTWLDAGQLVARGLARSAPEDLAGFAIGARASTPDLVALVLERPGAPARQWSAGGCSPGVAAEDLTIASLGGSCPDRVVARVVEVEGARAVAWMDLEALPSRIRAWTWVRELDNGRAWIVDEGGQVLVWSGGADVWLPMPVDWTRRAIQPDIFLWSAPRSNLRSDLHWEAKVGLPTVPWISWVLVPPGKRQRDLERAELYGLAFCLALGLGGFLLLPGLLRPLLPERDAPLPPCEPEPAPVTTPEPELPQPPIPKGPAWAELVEDVIEAATRSAGVPREQVTLEAPPRGIGRAPPPRREFGRALHLILDEALSASLGPWRMQLAECSTKDLPEGGVELLLLDPRPPPDEVERGALDRPIERAGAYQSLALARSLAASVGVALTIGEDAGQRCTRLVLGGSLETSPAATPEAPVAPALPAPAHPARAPAPRESGQARILLAEDNEANRLLIQALLASRGWSCDTLGDSREAVEAAGSGRYDLVLMDLHMPDMDGMDATRQIREAEEEADVPEAERIPVVAITADLVEGTRERCLQAGMDDFLSKPVELDALAEIVERYVGPPNAAS